MTGEALILLLLVKLWEKNAATSYEGAEWARESGGMGRLLIAQHRKLSIPTRGGQSLRTKFPCKPSYLTGTT